VGVVAVGLEANGCDAAPISPGLGDGRLRGHAQPWLRAEAVESKLDIRAIQGDIRAALNVRGAPAGVVDRNAIDGDVHEIEGERILRCQLP